MTLYASEYEAYQIRTGREIVAAYPELYNPWTIAQIGVVCPVTPRHSGRQKHRGHLCRRHPSFVVKPVGLGMSMGEGDIRLWYPFIRIGLGGNFISSASTGGIIACINVGTGMVETTGYDKLAKTIDVHPDTHFTIKGIKIPRWRQLCDKAIEMSERLPTLRYIGWDFVYDKDGEWIVMEGNENAEISSPQLIFHRGMREEFEQLIGYKPTKEYWWQGKYPSRFENIG